MLYKVLSQEDSCWLIWCFYDFLFGNVCDFLLNLFMADFLVQQSNFLLDFCCGLLLR